MADNIDFPVKRGRGRPPGSKDLQPRRKRADLQNFGQENIEPGDNTKFLTHALMIRNLPPIDTTNPVEVQERINEYFILCNQNDMKPTVTGFRMALGISRTTLFDWKQGTYREGTHQAIVCAAYDVLEGLWEDYMQNGKINPVSGIFLGKNNFQYADKQEYVLTPNQGSINEVDPATIEAKYAELPED